MSNHSLGISTNVIRSRTDNKPRPGNSIVKPIAVRAVEGTSKSGKSRGSTYRKVKPSAERRRANVASLSSDANSATSGVTPSGVMLENLPRTVKLTPKSLPSHINKVSSSQYLRNMSDPPIEFMRDRVPSWILRFAYRTLTDTPTRHQLELSEARFRKRFLQPSQGSLSAKNARGKNYSGRNAKRKRPSGSPASSRKRSSNG